MSPSDLLNIAQLVEAELDKGQTLHDATPHLLIEKLFSDNGAALIGALTRLEAHEVAEI